MSIFSYSIVRFRSSGWMKTFVFAHEPGLDVRGFLSALMNEVPELKKQSDQREIRIFQCQRDTYPKRLSDWEKSREICRRYEEDRQGWEEKLRACDRGKMEGSVGDAGDLPPSPERPSPEHYPLPPRPEQSAEPVLLPFDGGLRDRVEYLQMEDFAKVGLRVVEVINGGADLIDYEA